MSAALPETQIAKGIRFALETDPYLRIYTVQTIDNNAVDAWINHAILGLGNCSAPCAYRVIYDLSDISLYALRAFRMYTIGSLGMTISGQTKVRTILTENPELTAKLAIVTHPTLSARVTMKISRHQIDVPFKFFLSVERAKIWLKSGEDSHV